MSDLLTKILIIDDEPQIRKLLNFTLTEQNFKVIEAHDGREGASFSVTQKPELIVLDLGLPDMSGLDVLKKVREWSEVPIIILSVQNDSETIVEALNLGADDYMTKPFEAGELVARIRVCLRRSLKKESNQQVLEVRNLRLDLVSRILTKDGVEVKLTSTEYDLLKYLMKNVNKVVTNPQILKEVWGPGSLNQSQYPRVYIRHLRQKLEENPEEPTLILTESGIGYRLRSKD